MPPLLCPPPIPLEISYQIFGTFNVLLTMAAAQQPKTIETTCNSPLPPSVPQRRRVPPGIPDFPSICSVHVQYVKTATRPSEEGMGKPSKYFALPEASLGTDATVALKRASRASPQQMNPVRTTVSRYVRRPTTNASKAGATPNEI